ncbi:MAG: hypothetical protein IVW36_01220 [Dehalococcoidia bacterium]|nr:hypothetical protein [Dehalococcoidia bacterium]
MHEAETFMRGHAEKASSGRVAEILGDLTPDAMQQLMPMAAGLPNPATGYDIAAVSSSGDDHVFDVTYTGEGDKSATMRETVRQVEGAWRIVKIEKPA